MGCHDGVAGVAAGAGHRRREPRNDHVAHPSSALLFIEVAVNSLRTDTAIKPALFAAAGVPEMWVVDVAARRLIVLREPGPEGYATQTILGAGDRAEPLRLDLAPLELADLFRGL